MPDTRARLRPTLIRGSLLAWLASLAYLAQAAGVAPPTAEVWPPQFRLGRVYSGTEVELSVANRGDSPLQLQARPSAPGLTAVVSGPTVAARSVARIRFRLEAARPTLLHERILLESNDESQPIQAIPVEAEIRPVFLGPETLHFADLAPGERGHQTVVLSPGEPGQPLELTAVRPDLEGLSVGPLERLGDQVRFQVNVVAPAVGRYTGQLHLRFEQPLATEAQIPVSFGVVLRR